MQDDSLNRPGASTQEAWTETPTETSPMTQYPPIEFSGQHSNQSGDTEEIDPNNLPQIVYLRGDEPYFNDFAWGAEKVMEVLGIRRSRLTQITGRELRVGRRRDGRYIRPFYRPGDVEEYLSWTRATASHKKSSETVDEAAQNLTEQAEVFSQKFSAQSEELKSLLIQGQNTQLKKLTQGVTGLQQHVLATSKAQNEVLRLAEKATESKLLGFEKLLLENQQRMVSLQEQQLQLQKATVELISRTQFLETILLEQVGQVGPKIEPKVEQKVEQKVEPESPAAENGVDPRGRPLFCKRPQKLSVGCHPARKTGRDDFSVKTGKVIFRRPISR